MCATAEPERPFEEIYARASEDLASIPWASLAPHPALMAWLGRRPMISGEAVVVGCGLGDDAEALSRFGYQVSAFDIAPTAIAHCRQRFPNSSVDYRVADLFDLPDGWRQRFDLVVEIRTLQSLPVEQRPDATAAICGLVAAGGVVWVRCLAREDQEQLTQRPWPVSRAELRAFQDAGLRELEFQHERATPGGSSSLTVVYQRD